MATILIKNVEISDKKSTHFGRKKNILIDGTHIKSISNETTLADKIIEAEGLKISAGWFDLRSSFCDPGYEHKESLETGCKAAARGGFTGVAILPETKPIVQSKDTVAYIKSKSAGYLTDIFPMAAVTTDLKGNELAEIMDLHHAGAVAFTDGLHTISHAGVLSLALQYLQPIDGLIIQHAEDKNLTQFGQMNEGIESTYLGLKGMPRLAEELVIIRDLELLEYAGGKIHFAHISSAKSVELIANAKKKGLRVSCDVAVPNLIFDDSKLSTFDTNFKLNPPLRTQNDIFSLWNGLENGTIDAIATDHSPHDTESKHLEFDLADFGMIQLETAFAALVTYKPAKIEISLLIEKLTNGPRNVLSLPILKMEEGEIANLTLYSETEEWQYAADSILSKSKNSPFINQTLTGKVKAVFNNGLVEIY
ncbi:MAG: dihydroorotase [Cytophagales bacterium]